MLNNMCVLSIFCLIYARLIHLKLNMFCLIIYVLTFLSFLCFDLLPNLTELFLVWSIGRDRHHLSQTGRSTRDRIENFGRDGMVTVNFGH